MPFRLLPQTACECAAAHEQQPNAALQPLKAAGWPLRTGQCGARAQRDEQQTQTETCLQVVLLEVAVMIAGE